MDLNTYSEDAIGEDNGKVIKRTLEGILQ